MTWRISFFYFFCALLRTFPLILRSQAHFTVSGLVDLIRGPDGVCGADVPDEGGHGVAVLSCIARGCDSLRASGPRPIGRRRGPRVGQRGRGWRRRRSGGRRVARGASRGFGATRLFRAGVCRAAWSATAAWRSFERRLSGSVRRVYGSWDFGVCVLREGENWLEYTAGTSRGSEGRFSFRSYLPVFRHGRRLSSVAALPRGRNLLDCVATIRDSFGIIGGGGQVVHWLCWLYWLFRVASARVCDGFCAPVLGSAATKCSRDKHESESDSLFGSRGGRPSAGHVAENAAAWRTNTGTTVGWGGGVGTSSWGWRGLADLGPALRRAQAPSGGCPARAPQALRS